MKLPRQRGTVAFTLTETLISMSILTLVVGGVVYSHVMGMRLNAITMAKLGVDQQARNAFNRLQDEIRSATTVEIGNGTSNTFTTIASGTSQAGMAVRIYPSTNTATWIRYYFETNLSQLRRVQSTLTTPTIVAQYLTNSTIFQAEDHTGTVLTGPANNRVISINLRFYQLHYPQTKIGTNTAFDYYQLQSKITRRIL
ncbi:MAG: hypothetical protein B9S33_18375 [Pedosphaera sp. Tous-C6FEB]|nr:MAG: hypothetical protein B9S33_18375 [Pedosphaera sp. Tous-C6FEB]